MKRATRNLLIDHGLKTMIRSGYNGTSVRDVVASAGAPPGSFTNHFRSKEEFALEVLDRYFEFVRGLLHEAFQDTALTPRQRLIRYIEIVSGKLKDRKWSQGCLIGDFSLELPTQNEVLRQRLVAIFREFLQPFATCIAAAQAAREIPSDFDPSDLAEFLLASWYGAVLRMKVERSPAPIERFRKIMFQTVFAELI